MCHNNGKSVTPSPMGCSRHQLCWNRKAIEVALNMLDLEAQKSTDNNSQEDINFHSNIVTFLLTISS